MKVNDLLIQIDDTLEESYGKLAREFQAKFYVSPTGEKTFVNFAKNDIVYYENKKKRHFKPGEWADFEEELIASGYKEERNKRKLGRWRKTVNDAYSLFGFIVVGPLLMKLYIAKKYHDNWGDAISGVFGL